MNRALLFGALAIGTLLAPISGACADDQVIRIGVMNDMSGPYVDFQGPGSVLAAQMAVEDYGGKAAGRRSRSSLPITRTSRTSARRSPANGSTHRAWTPSPTCRTRPLRLR